MPQLSGNNYRDKKAYGRSTGNVGPHKQRYPPKRPVRDVPIRMNNKSLSGAASYDSETKLLNVIINDEDEDKNTMITQAVSVEPEEVSVEENEDIDSLAIRVQGKKSKDPKEPTKISHTIIHEMKEDPFS